MNAIKDMGVKSVGFSKTFLLTDVGKKKSRDGCKATLNLLKAKGTVKVFRVDRAVNSRNR